jgi:hypothetical protein
MSVTKAKKIRDAEAFIPVIQLYQSLTLEQCIELYIQQHHNFTQWQKRSILSVIGAKTVYKDKYEPNWKEKHKDELKNREEDKISN